MEGKVFWSGVVGGGEVRRLGFLVLVFEGLFDRVESVFYQQLGGDRLRFVGLVWKDNKIDIDCDFNLVSL